MAASPHWGPIWASSNHCVRVSRRQQQIGEFMGRRVFQDFVLRRLAISGLVVLIGIGSALTGSAMAQSGDAKAQDQSKPANANPADAARDSQRRTSEFTEAAQALNGPAGNPECVWFGRRVVRLMWNDDTDTALRHLDLYDRFGCPGGHVQAAFRCLTRFSGDIDSKVPDSLSSHVHTCWINPNAQPQTAAAAAPSAPATSGSAPAPQPAAAPPASTAPAAPAK
jgi:hypothetical protein